MKVIEEVQDVINRITSATRYRDFFPAWQDAYKTKSAWRSAGSGYYHPVAARQLGEFLDRLPSLSLIDGHCLSHPDTRRHAERVLANTTLTSWQIEFLSRLEPGEYGPII